MDILEHNFHDIKVVEKAVFSIFSKLKIEYLFVDSDYKYTADNDEYKSISISKKDLIISILISKREAYELIFTSPHWPKSKNLSLFDFAYNNVINSSLSQEYFIEIENESKKSIPYSEDYYYKLINSELSFIEQHFPTVFTEGDLSMFEK